MADLRLNGHRTVALGAGRRIVDGRHFRMDVAVELVVQIEVALVLQRGAARGALKAVHVQVLVLDAHEHTAAPARSSHRRGTGGWVRMYEVHIQWSRMKRRH